MIGEAIQRVRPGCRWTLEGDSLEGLTWLDDMYAKPTLSELQPVLDEIERERKQQAVSEEAERRIVEGTEVLPGVRFKCDTQSVTRIQGMKDAPDTAFPTAFMTEARQQITLQSKADAQAVFDTAAKYVAAVLSASASLQANVPEDYEDDTHWPPYTL